jgi:hypothetical protein
LNEKDKPIGFSDLSLDFPRGFFFKISHNLIFLTVTKSIFSELIKPGLILPFGGWRLHQVKVVIIADRHRRVQEVNLISNLWYLEWQHAAQDKP